MAKIKAKVGRPTNKEVYNRKTLKISTIAIRIAIIAVVVSLVVIAINYLNLVK